MPIATRWIESCERRLLFATDPVVVDLLALYTPGAASAHGGNARTESLIREVVDTTNAALSRSLIGITLRLVRVESIAYTGSGNLFTDRTRLQTPGDGFLDSVHSIRNTYGADIVHMVTDNAPFFGGNAALLDDVNRPDKDTLAFSVMDHTSLQPANLTFAHEVGHNLGGGHERGNVADPAVGPFSYSYGHRFTAADGNVYHDIMSYDPGLVIPYYANPAVSYAGTPTGSAIGNANEADIASTFAQTGPILAAYRATGVPDNTGPVASIYQLEPNGQMLTFTVRYRDDSGVDISSLDSSDIDVLTPEGFSLRAEFLGADGSSTVNESQKLARYRVTLPASNPPLASLQFVTRANQVRDIHSNFTPGGAMVTSVGDSAGWSFIQSRNLGAIAPTTILSESVSDNEDIDDAYRFTLASPATVSARLTGLSDDANVQLLRDANGNAVYDAGDFIVGSFKPGSADRAVGANFAAGTYFVWVYRQNPGGATPYTLTLQRYDDVTPPTGMLDATDMKTPGAPHLDFYVDYADDHEVSGVGARFDAGVNVNVQLDGGGSFSFVLFPDFALNESNPQNAPTYRTLYRLPAFNSGTGWTAADNGLYTISVAPNNPRARDVAGNDIPLIPLGSFRIAIGTADNVAPTATLTAPSILVPGGATHDFTVEYRDNVALDGGTVGTGDLRVTGPGGFDQLATFVSLTPAPTIGSKRIATYRISAPGGAWAYTHNGMYTIALQSNQVRDISNNAIPAGSIGSLAIHVPYPGDANGDDSVSLDDFNLLASNFGQAGRGVPHGDFTYDGLVNLDDFNVLASNFGTSIGQSNSLIRSFSGVLARKRVVDSLRHDLLS